MLSAKRAFIFVVAIFVIVQLCLAYTWIYAHSQNADQRENKPKETIPSLLTLFTTMKPSDQRIDIHLRTLKHAASLMPHIHPVLMVQGQDQRLGRVAKQLGWTVLRLQDTEPPRIRVMFQEAIAHFQSKFYAFTNADILFDHGLVDTLQSLEAFDFPDGFLLVGQRHNINVEAFHEHMALGVELSLWKHQAQLFGPDAQDYFITTKDGFPWERVPDLVIGRPAYDNWLLTQSLVWNITLVDGTDTVFALHQTGADGNKAGWKSSDKCTNRDLVGPYEYGAGRTICTKWRTLKDFSGRIRLVQRPETERPDYCKIKKIGYNVGVMDVVAKSRDPTGAANLIFPDTAKNSDRSLNINPLVDRKKTPKIVHQIVQSVGGQDHPNNLTFSQKAGSRRTLRKSKLSGVQDVEKRRRKKGLRKKTILMRKKKKNVISQRADRTTNAPKDKVPSDHLNVTKTPCKF